MEPEQELPDRGPSYGGVRALTVAVLLGGLLVWGHWRTLPRTARIYEPPWSSGTQIVPLTVALLSREPRPTDARLRTWLDARSVIWSQPNPEERYVAYLRISEHHWARRFLAETAVQTLLGEDSVSDRLMPGAWIGLRCSIGNFLDDDDDDGDPLDAGELVGTGDGIEVILAGQEPG